MTRIVAEETELGEHACEIGGYHQLPPGVAHEQECGPAPEQQRDRDSDPPGVMSRIHVQQACLPHET
jgi:hypothetical protein